MEIVEEGDGQFPALSLAGMVLNSSWTQHPISGGSWEIQLQRGSGYCLLHSGTEKTLQATPSLSFPGFEGL